MIETAEHYFYNTREHKASRRMLEERPLVLMREVLKLSIPSYINYSRWVVDCPNCYNTEFYWEDGLFFCSVCKNEAVGGKLYPVAIPKERKQIENILELRPRGNRNWKTGESIDLLKSENIEHELGVS